MNLRDCIHSYVSDPIYFEEYILSLLRTQNYYDEIKNNKLPRKLLIDALKIATENNHYDISHRLCNYFSHNNVKCFQTFSEIFINAICKTDNDIIELLYYKLNLHPHYKQNSPLYHAIKHNKLQTVKLLLRDRNVLRKIKSYMLGMFYIENESFMYFIAQDSIKNLRNESVLLLAIENNNNEMFDHILKQNIIQYMDCAFIKTILNNDNTKMLSAICNKFNIQILDNIWKCGFLQACCDGKLEAIKYILERKMIVSNANALVILAHILFEGIQMNSNTAKSLVLLINHNVITNDIICKINPSLLSEYVPLINGCGKSSRTIGLIMAIYLRHQKSNYIDNNCHIDKTNIPIMDMIFGIYDYKSWPQEYKTIFNKSITILLSSPKLNKYYEQIKLVLCCKGELYCNHGWIEDVYDIIIKNMIELSLHEYLM